MQVGTTAGPKMRNTLQYLYDLWKKVGSYSSFIRFWGGNSPIFSSRGRKLYIYSIQESMIGIGEKKRKLYDS